MAGKTLQLTTVLPIELAQEFIHIKRVKDLDTMPHINKHVKRAISQFIKDNIGYDTEQPIAALSRFNNQPGELKTVGTSVADFIPTKSGSTLWQLTMPEDMAVSIAFTDLVTFSNLLDSEDDSDLIESYVEEFMQTIKLGFLDDEDVISFIPFIDLSRCTFFALVNPSWGIGNFTVPGVEQVKLTSMDVFHTHK